jgi:hypothetical protein
MALGTSSSKLPHPTFEVQRWNAMEVAMEQQSSRDNAPAMNMQWLIPLF